MRLVVLLPLALLLSGCSDPAAPEESPPPAQDPVPEPSPEPVFAPIELFNETLALAHFATGANEASGFLLVEGARAFHATVWVRVECPLTSYNDPRVSLTSPDGDVHDVPLMPESNASLCPFVDPEFVLRDEVELAPVAGEWTVETAGDCSCEARVAVTAEVPE